MELLNLDMRDLVFWFRQAQLKLIQDQMKRIQAARVAGAVDSSYDRVMDGLALQAQEIEHGKEQTIQENWEFLRGKGRG